MKKVLTVVIPTYNMEKYLAHCLESFIFDEAEKGLEILIVNDGSTDETEHILAGITSENGGGQRAMHQIYKSRQPRVLGCQKCWSF